MKYMKRNTYIPILLIVICVLYGTGAHVSTYHSINKKDISSTDYWVSRIHSVGGKQAYGELVNALSTLDPSQQHGDAHIFGGALFTVEGLLGIAACDSQFSYGCYHEFIGHALASDGLAVLPQIRAVCDRAAAPTACRHGIGHGLLAYFGYSAEDVGKTVAVCVQMGDTAREGCLGGLFMEHNMRTMTGQGNVRPLDNSLDAPCDSYTGTTRASCMYYQPQWWWSVLPGNSLPDKTALIARMAALCPKSKETQACLMVPPSVAYSPERSADLCKKVTTSMNDETYCDAGAAVVFAGTTGNVDAAKVCDRLSGERNVFCTEFIASDTRTLSIELSQ